jgi:glyoxylase I family protein
LKPMHGGWDMPAVAAIHHVSLTVCNLKRSTEWYRALLGLDKILEEPHPDGSGVGVVLADPEHKLFIGLHAHDANSGERFSETRTGLDHVGIGVPDRPELVRWQRRLEEAQAPHSPIADMPYGSMLVFRDPDNIQLEFFAPAQG